MLTVTPIYGAALAVLFLYLSARVIGARRDHKVSLGDGGQPELGARIRAHGNFAEYAPFGLLLLVIAELAGANVVLLHLAGLCLVVGRALHAACFLFPASHMPLRVTGMALTLVALGGAAVLALVG